MKKRDKLKLKIKSKLYELALFYLMSVLSFKLGGNFQELINYNAVKGYKEVVKDFADFLEEKGVVNPSDIFDYYSFALWSGYLSYNHNFEYSFDRDVFFSNSGIACIKGESVCQNNADMLRAIYEEFGYDAYIQPCYISSESQSRDESEESVLPQEIEETVFLSKLLKLVLPVSYIFGNHAVTAVNYEGEVYYYDPTNFLYLAGDGSKLELLNGDGNFSKKYLYMPYLEIDSLLKEFTSSKATFENFFTLQSDEEPYISMNDLEAFYQEEKELIREINSSLGDKNTFKNFATIVIIYFFLIKSQFSYIYKFLNKKDKQIEEELMNIVNSFFEDNGIEKFGDVCLYLRYLIDNGYLSYEKGDTYLKLKWHVISQKASLVTVDNQEFGKYFFEQFINKKFGSLIHHEIGTTEDRKIVNLYMYKKNNEYLFYSYKENLAFSVDDDYRLVSGDRKLEIPGSLKNIMRKHSEIISDVASSVDSNLCDDFYKENEKNIENIAKSYSYVPKK